MATRYYLRDTNNETTCDDGGSTPFDLSTTQGTSAELVSGNVNDTAFTFIFGHQIDVTGESPVSGVGTHDLSISVAGLSGDVEYFFRLTCKDYGACSGVNDSVDSATFSTTGTKTFSLDLDWDSSCEGLRVATWIRRASGHGNVSITLDVNDAATYCDAPWPAAGGARRVFVIS